MAFTLISFVLVTALVAFISWYKTRGTDETNKEGYFLAGRSLTGIVIFGSLMMTNLSAEQLVGRNGQGYAAGMTAMGWESMCPIALTLMALFFVPRYFKLGITTIPEFLEDRYDRATRVMVSFIFLVAYIVTMLPLVLYAGSVAMERIFDVTSLCGGNRFMAISIMCIALGIIGGIYAIFGGLKAVAVSDSLNGVIFIIGAVILIPILAFTILGHGNIVEGIRIFATASPEHLNAIQPANAQPPYIPWPMIVIGCGINHVSYYCTNQSIMQRVLGAKNLKEAQKGALLSGFVLVFCPIFLVAPGIIQFIRDGGVLTDFDMAYPTLVRDILPAPLLGFFAAVMFGAILSSFN
ncbi:MAG: solute:sodium symporter family transporter, partial [Butyricicoccus sp.]